MHTFVRTRTWSRDGPLCFGLIATLTYWLVPYSLVSEIVLFDGVVALAAVASVVGARRAPAGQRIAWRCSSAALVLFLIGELVWSAYAAFDRDPFPSVADASFLLAYLPLALAAAALASARHSRPDRSAMLDATILTAVAGLILFAALMEPLVHDQTATLASKLVALAYPLADLLVLGFLLRLVFSRQSRTRGATLFTLGVAATLTADVAFGWQTLQGVDGSGSWLELPWLVGYLLIGFAPLYPAAASPSPRTQVPDGTGRGRLVLVLMAVAVPQVVLAREFIKHGLIAWDTLTIATCVSAAVIVLVSVRLWLLLERTRRLEQDRGARRLSALIHHSADAIFLLDREGRIGFASPAAEILGGRPAEAHLGTALLDWFALESRSAMASQLRNLVALPTGATVPLEGSVSRGDSLRTVEGTGCNLLADDNVGSIVVTLRDVTSRRQLEAQLERQAFQDELTGLANRALFADRVGHALQRSVRRDRPGVAVLFLDIDDLKAVNDGMGRDAGDDLLRGVAERIRNGLRPADTVARIGGDEFAVLLEDVTSHDQAVASGERVLELLQLPIEVSGVGLAVGASIGIMLATPDCTVESLLRDADIAMYNAKALGKGRIATFDESLFDLASQRLALRLALPEALRTGQFALDYQPIIDVQSNTLRGFEALVRWHHPTRGLLLPGDFIAAAEESGAIIELGRFVLSEACRQVVIWNERRVDPLTMNVNVSTPQLHEPGLVDGVSRVLSATGLSPSLLVLELTESVLAHQRQVKPTLEALRSLGVGIAIDDFGTGYSSLSYLQGLPVTGLKVDRSFVVELSPGAGAGGNRALLESILSMAAGLGLTCVAEGVETQAQFEALTELHCPLAQGYHLGRPMAADAVDRLLEGELRESLLP